MDDEEYTCHLKVTVDKNTKKVSITTDDGDEVELLEESKQDILNCAIKCQVQPPAGAPKKDNGSYIQAEPKKPAQKKCNRKRQPPKAGQKDLDQLKLEIEKGERTDEEIQKMKVDDLRKILGIHQNFHRLLEDKDANLSAHGKWKKAPKCWPANKVFIDPNNGTEQNGTKSKPTREVLISMLLTFKELYKQYKNQQVTCQPQECQTDAYEHKELVQPTEENTLDFAPYLGDIDPDDFENFGVHLAPPTIPVTYEKLTDAPLSPDEMVLRLEQRKIDSSDHPGLYEQLERLIQLFQQHGSNNYFLTEVNDLLRAIEKTSSKQENWNSFSNKCTEIICKYMFDPGTAAPAESAKVRKTTDLETASDEMIAKDALNISLRNPDGICDPMMPVALNPVELDQIPAESKKKDYGCASGDDNWADVIALLPDILPECNTDDLGDCRMLPATACGIDDVETNEATENLEKISSASSGTYNEDMSLHSAAPLPDFLSDEPFKEAPPLDSSFLAFFEGF